MILGAAGLFYWKESRPHPPKPWNTAALTATFDRLGVEGDKNHVVFRYVLQNNLQSDYRLDGSVVVMGRLAQPESLVENRDNYLIVDQPLFIPAGHRVRFTIRTPVPYSKRLSDSATDEERKAFRKALTEFVNEKMGNLNGFAFFDATARYKIEFPKGW